ncbi:hypothetical protein CDL15_Pgr025442 [Punica granatum]|uniref:Dirigent protein n=1 Tax=Punica granatum TaxID=22663 RepID=A0A218W8Z3_PUNGR|nr:hypothetical protein CDL15_Pgr025442 [Punica granatum]PKI73615.1 hypothetical protein CRG98_005989 [Punica granatum]
MAMNFAFVEGKYNGSSLTVLGRNPVFDAVREMPVVGGIGLFRFAHGDSSSAVTAAQERLQHSSSKVRRVSS